MEQLTVSQAEEQGYEYYGYAGERYQSMHPLLEFDPQGAKGTERLFNVDPEPSYTVSADFVKDLLIDHISDEWDSDTGDDTGEMYSFLNEIPVDAFSAIASLLSDAVANKHYYKLTDIKLVPNDQEVQP